MIAVIAFVPFPIAGIPFEAACSCTISTRFERTDFGSKRLSLPMVRRARTGWTAACSSVRFEYASGVKPWDHGTVVYADQFMRVTVNHDKGLEGAKKIVNESADQLLGSAASGPVKITDMHRQWNANTMDFSFVGRMGFFSAPIKGQVFVTEKDVTIDVELPGLLKQFMPEEKVRAQVEGRVRGLLNG